MAAGEAGKPDLVALAFEIVAERGWARFSFTELADRAGVSLEVVYRALPARASLLRELGRRADAAMLGVDRAELAEMGPRDRAFELIMRRLDALAAFKAGLRAMARAAPADAMLVAATACNVDRATAWVADACGMPVGGVRGMAGRKLLGLVYLQTVRVWLGDDTADSARTLAELDKRLRQAEALARLCPWRRRPDEPRAAAAA